MGRPGDAQNTTSARARPPPRWAKLTIDEALTTGRAIPILRALWHQATTTVAGFAVSLLLFLGYAFGVSFIAIAALKRVFPGNVGLFVIDGVPHSFGALFPAPAGAEVVGGYWVIPISLSLGLAVLVGTHRGARRFLAWWRERRRESPVLALRLPWGRGVPCYHGHVN